nr:hypothetical protein GCM10020093_023520 [Planobispora longispora]
MNGPGDARSWQGGVPSRQGGGGPASTDQGGPAASGREGGTAGRLLLHSLAWRALVWAAGTAALLVAMPPDYRAGPVMPLLAVLISLLTAADPDGGWVSATQAVAVAAWLLTTMLYGYSPSPAMGLLIGLLLYLHHGMAAIAAQVRPRPASRRRSWSPG